MLLLTGRRLARAMPWLRLLALLPVTVLAAHEAVFLAQYGPGAPLAAAMRDGGHAAYWTAFSVIIAAITLGVLARQAVHWARLRLQLVGAPARVTAARTRDLAHAIEQRGTSGAWWAEFRSIWPPLFALAAIGFTIQENVEHVAAGQAPHGLGSLIGSEHPLALPILALVSAAVAAIGALITWRVRVLEERVARVARRHRHRHPASIAPMRRPTSIALGPSWFLVRLDAGRAPPAAR